MSAWVNPRTDTGSVLDDQHEIEFTIHVWNIHLCATARVSRNDSVASDSPVSNLNQLMSSGGVPLTSTKADLSHDMEREIRPRASTTVNTGCGSMH